jgi:hypothetical protein
VEVKNSMSTIKEFLSQAIKGAWVTANRCNVGDVLQVTSVPEIDNQTFQGKTYLVMNVILERTKESLRLRLSATAVQNLVGVFTEQATDWVGKRIKVVAKQNYPGLGKSGLIYAVA